jgi:hypothetical protein
MLCSGPLFYVTKCYDVDNTKQVDGLASPQRSMRKVVFIIATVSVIPCKTMHILALFLYQYC